MDLSVSFSEGSSIFYAGLYGSSIVLVDIYYILQGLTYAAILTDAQDLFGRLINAGYAAIEISDHYSGSQVIQ
jgi:hypothetical protein